MSLHRIVTFVISLNIPSTALAAPTNWNLDDVHSHVSFKVKHLAITNVKGELKTFDAAIVADADTGKLQSVDAVAKTKSIDTGNKDRDDHLRSDDFFAAKKHPELKLKSKSITWTGNEFVADVDLTLRGVTKTITFKGELSGGPTKVDFGAGPQLRIGYTATGTVNRKDFGLSWSKAIELVPVVADDVKIELEIEASRKTP
jgi:polyisoprenoid-binding protein YceI